MNIRRFRSENLAFEKTSGIVTQGTRRSVLGQFPPPLPPPPPEGKSHIKVKGMLVGKLKFNPLREPNVGVAQA